jgi:serine protease Do
MSAEFRYSRKTVKALVAAALLSTSVLAGSLVAIPAHQVQAQAAIQAIDPSKGFSALVEHVMPAVVDVQVKIQNAAASDGEDGMPDGQQGQIPPQFRDFFNQFPQFRDQFRGPQQPRPHQGMAQGSGFVISADGYVVTNNHVVDNASQVSLTFKNGDEYDAEVIGTDPKTDVALLKIKSDKSFPFVPFATSEAKVGDWVLAVGNPFGLGGTVTSGIVSANGRDIGNGPYDDFLQIDASINRGNSGGPAFNMTGEVIGMNTAIFSPSGGSVGIGFAIPASIVKDVVQSLKTNGAVTRGWLGVRIQPVTADLAEGLGLDKVQGAVVSEVTENSPALKAGLKQGDTILKVDSTEISNARDLSKTVAKVAPGKDITLSIIRDKKPQTVTVKVGTMPGEPEKMAAAPAAKPTAQNLSVLGLEVAPADDGAGVKVTGVKPDSPAADRGISVGDVILEIAGVEVNSTTDVQTALKDSGNKRVLMLLKSGDNQRYVALPNEKG